MSYAGITDVSARLGRAITSAAEVLQVETWIDDAERLITRRIPDLAARITSGAISADDVVRVAAQAVVRKVKNPDGKQNERIDDYSYGLVKEAAQAEIHITDEEWEILLADPASSVEGAFTIRTVPVRSSAASLLTVDGWR